MIETVRRGLEINSWENHPVSGSKVSKVVRRIWMLFRQDLPRSDHGAWEISLVYLTDLVLISHLRMEGKYFFYPDKVPLRKNTPMSSFHFTDGSTLVYEDVRKFGTMKS